MRKLTSIAMLMVFAAWVGGANAQTATQDISISATVNGTCTIDNAATGSSSSASIPITSAGAVNTASITPTGAPYANVACNTPSSLQLKSLSGGVKNSSTASGFANIINYQASATWNSVTASVNTATTAGADGEEAGTSEEVATAYSGSMSVSVTPAANTLPLVQGSYTDTLRITLTPQ